jgi:hypothetical protein
MIAKNSIPSIIFLLLPTVSAACGGAGPEVEASIDQKVSTRIVVRWETDESATTWVEFGGEGLETITTPPIEGTEHNHKLLGLGSYQEVWYRAVTVMDDREYSSEGEITTGGIPAEMPDFTVTVDEPSLQSPEPYILGTTFGLVPALFAIDRQGQWLWYHEIEGDIMPVELELELEGDGFLFNTFADDYTQDNSTVRRLSFTGDAPWEHPTPLAHHAFTQLPNGAAAWLALDIRDWTDPYDGTTYTVVGDAVVVKDADGQEHTLCSTWDWTDPVVTEEFFDDFYEQGRDWTHANALNWNETRGTLMIGLRNLQTMVELEVDFDNWTTTPILQLGSFRDSEIAEPTDIYRLDKSSHNFNFLHSPGFTPNGDFMGLIEYEQETLVVQWTLDDARRELHQSWAYGEGEGLRTFFLGQARELPNGNRMVVYSSEGVIRELTPDGQVAWELQSSAGGAFGELVLFDDFYTP